LQKVIQNLLADRVPVRDLELLGELVLNSNSSDADRLSESARLLLAPNILSNLDVEGTVYVVRLGPRLNAALAGQPNKAAVLGRVKQAVEALKGQRRQPVLVASPQARRALRRLSAREYPDLVVLSSSEMLPPYRFKTLRVVDLP
jgi:flagellar biosynthesis component FlhA